MFGALAIQQKEIQIVMRRIETSEHFGQEYWELLRYFIEKKKRKRESKMGEGFDACHYTLRSSCMVRWPMTVSKIKQIILT